MKTINLDSNTAFVMDDRRGKKPSPHYLLLQPEDRRKTPHDYETKVLCVMVDDYIEVMLKSSDQKIFTKNNQIEIVDFSNKSVVTFDAPLKSGDQVCLAEEWYEDWAHNKTFTKANPIYLSNGDKGGVCEIDIGMINNFKWQPYSTMPPHLGKNFLITGDCFGVEEIEPEHSMCERCNGLGEIHFDHQQCDKCDGSGAIKIHYFQYPVKELIK